MGPTAERDRSDGGQLMPCQVPTRRRRTMPRMRSNSGRGPRAGLGPAGPTACGPPRGAAGIADLVERSAPSPADLGRRRQGRASRAEGSGRMIGPWLPRPGFRSGGQGDLPGRGRGAEEARGGDGAPPGAARADRPSGGAGRTTCRDRTGARRSGRPRAALQHARQDAVRGRWPSMKVLMLMITFSPMSIRPSIVAEPMCGRSTTFSSWRSFGLMAGSCSNTSRPAPAISRRAASGSAPPRR